MDEERILEECQPVQRKLSAWEIHEARKVFGNQLDYLRVRVHECAAWPNYLDRLGRKIKGLPPPVVPNAITIRYNCYFPVRLPQALVPTWHPEHYKISWLIHELTHVWQYQKLGYSYIFRAVEAQFRGGIHAYDFGGESGLQDCIMKGKTLNYFNLEQQGEICRSYYNRLACGDDVENWLPFIKEIQNE